MAKIGVVSSLRSVNVFSIPVKAGCFYVAIATGIEMAS